MTELKRVSFEVAKVLKEVGYHEPSEYFYGDGYDDEDNPEHKFILCVTSIPTYVQDWNNTDKFPIYESEDKKYWENVMSAPTYMDVWLWLWREKGIWMEILNISGSFLASINQKPFGELVYSDPEAAIISSIEYLVDNNLIK